MAAFDPKRTFVVSVSQVPSVPRTGASQPPRTQKYAPLRPKPYPGCQQSSRLAQWLKHKAVGAGVSEEKEGPASGPDGIGAGAEARAQFARAAAFDLTPSEKSALARLSHV